MLTYKSIHVHTPFINPHIQSRRVLWIMMWIIAVGAAIHSHRHSKWVNKYIEITYADFCFVIIYIGNVKENTIKVGNGHINRIGFISVNGWNKTKQKKREICSVSMQNFVPSTAIGSKCGEPNEAATIFSQTHIERCIIMHQTHYAVVLAHIAHTAVYIKFNLFDSIARIASSQQQHKSRNDAISNRANASVRSKKFDFLHFVDFFFSRRVASFRLCIIITLNARFGCRRCVYAAAVDDVWIYSLCQCILEFH